MFNKNIKTILIPFISFTMLIGVFAYIFSAVDKKEYIDTNTDWKTLREKEIKSMEKFDSRAADILKELIQNDGVLLEDDYKYLEQKREELLEKRIEKYNKLLEKFPKKNPPNQSFQPTANAAG